VPALPASILEPLWAQVAALLPTRRDTHPLGCHRPRIPDRIVFDKLIQVLVFGCSYRRIADHTCSATTLRRRRDEWMALGLAEQLRLLVLAAYDRLFGLELAQLAVDGCTTKAPCGGQVAGPSPVDRRKQGLKRSLVTDAEGIPLGVVAAAANRRDDGLLAATLDTLTVVAGLPKRPMVHLDAGYDYQTCGRCWLSGAWPARSPPAGSPPRSRPAAAGRWSAPMPGQPVRQAALVHRTPPGRGGLLAGAGRRGDRVRPAGPSRLDLLPLGPPTQPPPVITYWHCVAPWPGRGGILWPTRHRAPRRGVYVDDGVRHLGSAMASTEGFEAFYAATVGRLLGQLLPVTGDLYEAEEVVQEAFARASARWTRLRDYDVPEAWVRRVAINLATDRSRQLRRQARALLRLGPPPQVPAASAEAVALLEALRTLPMRQRQAIVLHYLVDLPIEEVARTLGTGPGAVKSQLARGRRTLANRLSDAEEVLNSP
jgi:RNA polymerase sigma-70 factor (sigma-E family)